MEINEYQDLALKTVTYPNAGCNILYPALKLAGESGEVADKVGKWWRNHGATAGCHLTDIQKQALVLELGDVLWYIAAMGQELGITLDEIALLNLEKLRDRKERGVIKGEGDNR